jgi:hypothetical protein
MKKIKRTTIRMNSKTVQLANSLQEKLNLNQQSLIEYCIARVAEWEGVLMPNPLKGLPKIK